MSNVYNGNEVNGKMGVFVIFVAFESTTRIRFWIIYYFYWLGYWGC